MEDRTQNLIDGGSLGCQPGSMMDHGYKRPNRSMIFTASQLTFVGLPASCLLKKQLQDQNLAMTKKKRTQEPPSIKRFV